MKLHTSFLPVLVLTCAVATLSACGGGGGGAVVADASDKYVGVWNSACVAGAPSGGNSFYKTTLTISKIGAATYSLGSVINGYPAAGCSGAGTLVPGDSGTLVQTIVGNKTIGADLVDKVTYPNGVGTSKDVAFVNTAGPTLQRGNSGALDADGFPTTLEATRYAKQ